MNQRYTDSVGVRLILIFFATVLLVRVRGQDEASSICAAEGSWKTNMCAKETDFYGNVTCIERLIVLSEEGEEIDVLATMVELKSELTIVRSQNTELRNRLSHVETTVMPSPPPPPPPSPSPPPSPPPPSPPVHKIRITGTNRLTNWKYYGTTHTVYSNGKLGASTTYVYVNNSDIFGGNAKIEGIANFHTHDSGRSVSVDNSYFVQSMSSLSVNSIYVFEFPTVQPLDNIQTIVIHMRGLDSIDRYIQSGWSGSYLELLNENNEIVYQSGLLQTDYVGNMAYLLWKGPSYNTITYPTSDPFTSNSNALEYTPNYENR